MKNLLKSFKTGCLIIVLCLISNLIKAETLHEESSVSFNNYEVHHQGINRLNIKLTWRPRENTSGANISDEFIFIKVDSFFHNYPNTTDWWEVVNKALTQMIMNTYPDMESISSDIEVTWVSGAGVNYGHRYPTRCLTSRTWKGILYEYFGFRTLPDFTISTSSDTAFHVHLDILYRYKEPVANTEYPDGLVTENAFKSFLNEFAKDTPFEKVNKKCAEAMLEKFPEMNEITSEITYKDSKLARTTKLILKR